MEDRWKGECRVLVSVTMTTDSSKDRTYLNKVSALVERYTGTPWPRYVVLAAGRRQSAPLETATPDADSFFDDCRMGVESSSKIMPCL